jgi:NAD(P)-dependent dehydrogenase (short-subunit alcohol dehydrogenase family)
MSSEQNQTLPPQTQDQQPGRESEMHPRPDYEPRYPGSGRLKGKVALVTGGDSGIGRAVSVLFAREGADVAVLYLNEGEDAQETKRLVEREGRKCVTIAGDVGDPGFCRSAVDQVIEQFGKLDVLVNNAAEQHPKRDIGEITPDQLDRTFRTNIFGYFYMTQAAMPHLKQGASIINTTSVTAYRGSPELLDYSSTKGAILAFTRSLSKKLAEEGIRVNGVAPGPIWTPLIQPRRWRNSAPTLR